MLLNKIISFDFFLLIKAIIYIFWTWLLNFIYKRGHPKLTWLIVLFPLFIYLLWFLTDDETSDKEKKKNHYYLANNF
jgi:hypothetical protein